MKSFIKKTFYFFYQNLQWVITIFLFFYTFVPVLSPILFKLGAPRTGWWIQTIYRLFCHQRPERSIFLFGEKFVYSVEELRSHGYTANILGYPFIGNESIGYKVAFCTRDLFIYGAMAITGLFVALYKKYIKMKWWMVVLTVIPMFLDGGVQFISEFLYLSNGRFGIYLAKPFYLSNNLNRAVTGLIFGAGVGLFIFSELKAAVQEE